MLKERKAELAGAVFEGGGSGGKLGFDHSYQIPPGAGMSSV